MKTPRLNAVLKYTNKAVIDSFMTEFSINELESEKIFRQMLKFLWFTQLKPEHATIDTPILIIDKMWHTFILHTIDYSRFCKKYFHCYLHHNPSSPFKKAANQSTVIEQKREKYSAIIDILGEECFSLWYLQFPDQYSPKQILSLRMN